MARSRDEARGELTTRAYQQGIEVTPGQLEQAGLSEAEEAARQAEEAAPYTGATFWRVRIVNATINDPGAPDHVVRAPDRANAWETFRREFGVISVDEAVNKREITPATEADFILAQAKCLRVDLREQRQKPLLAGTNKPDKKHPDYGLLTWEPPGGRQGKYRVSDTGELTAVE